MNYILKFTGLLVTGMLFSLVAFSQSIKGTITDTTGKPVPYANVNLKNDSNLIVAYAISNTAGQYQLTPPAGLKLPLHAEVTSIGFKKQTKTITDFSVPINFVLSVDVNQLKSVIVKDSRPRLRTHGDTTGYKVSDFSSAQDRVIGDVIKKLPGVTVASDGKISYNGKAISNLYIGGDDLLEDKYNIATNTIPNGVVDQVQVIENHQPIKMLQNKVYSDDVAMNLTIKKNAKLQLVGQETLGAGLPGNYDVDINAMMFKDKYKAINYLKGNNIGDDLQNDLIGHNRAEYLQGLDNNPPATLLSLGTVSDPNLMRDRYLFNQSGIINANNLVNLKSGVQLRVNFYYLHDTQKQDFSQQTTVFLPADTVRYSETQHNKFVPDVWHGQFTLNVNKDKYYLNDALLTDYTGNTDYSALNTNGTNVNQRFTDNNLNFSNELNMMRTASSNNILGVYSYINHVSEPENRVIEPNFNPAIFNNGNAYAQLIQTANVPTWFTNNYLQYKIPGNILTQSIKAGFLLQSQKVTSDLSAVQLNNSSIPVSDSAMNRLNWSREKAYAELDYDLPGTILKMTLSLPLSLQRIQYNDSLYAVNKNLTRVYFNPLLKVKYMVGKEDYFTALYNYRNAVGNIEDVYSGNILNDYRTFYANNGALTETENQLAILGFNYRKALTLFFFSTNASFNHINANNIVSSIITNNLQQRIVLPFQNSTNSWTINGYISKYSFALLTTFSAGVQWQSNASNQIQNNTLLPYKTVSTNLNVSADTKISDAMTLDYKANFMQTTSSSAAAPGYSIRQLVQQASVNYNPLTNLFFKLSGDDYLTYQTGNNLSYFFADASVKFRLNKLKSDVELSAVNFLNVKNYSYLNLSANTLTSSSYTLPGRILLVKLMFNL